MKTNNEIKKHLYEINFPNEFNQSVLVNSEYEFLNLTKLDLKVIDTIIYIATNYIVSEYKEDEINKNEFENIIPLYYRDISNVVEDNTTRVKNSLEKLISTYILMNIKVDVVDMLFIKNIDFEKDYCLIEFNKEFLTKFLYLKENFTKFYLKLNFGLNKNAMIIYKLLKSYEWSKNRNGIDIDLNVLYALFNLDSDKTNFSYFQRDTLKKSLKDINENSDIFVDFVLKDSFDRERKKVKRINFNIESKGSLWLEEFDKECRGELEDDSISDSEIDKLIDEYVEEQLAIQLKSGIKIRDKERYKIGIKNKIDKKEFENKIIFEKEYERVKSHFEIGFSHQPTLLTLRKKGDYKYYAVTNDYLLMELPSNKIVSEDASDTMFKISFLRDECGYDWKREEVDSKGNGHLKISYLNADEYF